MLEPPPAPPPESPPEVPWGVRDVLLGLLVLILTFVAVVVYFVWAQPDVDLGILVSLGELVMVVPIAVIVFWKRRAGWGALGFRRFDRRALWLALALLIVAYVINGLYAALLSLFDLQIQADVQALLSQLTTPWYFVLGAAVIAPVVEETFFRGFVFAGIRKRMGWQPAAILTSVLFALAHGEWTAFLPIFLLGLMLTYLYQRSRSLWPGILFHVANNSVTIIAIYVAQRTGVQF